MGRTANATCRRLPHGHESEMQQEKAVQLHSCMHVEERAAVALRIVASTSVASGGGSVFDVFGRVTAVNHSRPHVGQNPTCSQLFLASACEKLSWRLGFRGLGSGFIGLGVCSGEAAGQASRDPAKLQGRALRDMSFGTLRPSNEAGSCRLVSNCACLFLRGCMLQGLRAILCFSCR